MWIPYLLLPIPILYALCLYPLPKEFLKISPIIPAFLIIPAALALTAYHINFTDSTRFLCYVIALMLYFIIRGCAFIGADASFRKFELERKVEMSFPGTILTWAITFIEPIAIFTILILAYTIRFPGNLLEQKGGQSEVRLYVDNILLAGVCLSYLILLAMNENRKRVNKDIARRAAKTAGKGTSLRPSPSIKAPTKK